MRGKEVLPNPADTFQSVRYLQDQARLGMFKGRLAAYTVLTYLVTNMWVRIPNKEDAGIGQVMYGRSGLRDIAEGTTLSLRGAAYALTWLEDEGWLETDRTYTSTGRDDKKSIILMLDHRAHVSRMRRREAGMAVDKILLESMGGSTEC